MPHVEPIPADRNRSPAFFQSAVSLLWCNTPFFPRFRKFKARCSNSRYARKRGSPLGSLPPRSNEQDEYSGSWDPKGECEQLARLEIWGIRPPTSGFHAQFVRPPYFGSAFGRFGRLEKVDPNDTRFAIDHGPGPLRPRGWSLLTQRSEGMDTAAGARALDNSTQQFVPGLHLGRETRSSELVGPIPSKRTVGGTVSVASRLESPGRRAGVFSTDQRPQPAIRFPTTLTTPRAGLYFAPNDDLYSTGPSAPDVVAKTHL